MTPLPSHVLLAQDELLRGFSRTDTMGIPEVQVLFHTFDGIEVYYLLCIGGELSRQARGPILGSLSTLLPHKLNEVFPGQGPKRLLVFQLLLNPPMDELQDCK